MFDLSINVARFHPLLVHMPIGILVLAFLMEIWRRWKHQEALQIAIQFALGAGFLFGLLSVGTGFLLANEGGYPSSTLNTHKWLGIALTAVTGLLWWLSRAENSTVKRLYFSFFMVTMILLTLTGHHGGKMTHGANYLVTQPEEGSIEILDITSTPVYETIIQPIISAKCNNCHNPSKAKGGLIMTTVDDLLKGGENGSIFDADEPLFSPMLARINLPLEEKEHMPPKGKKQLTTDEIRLLEWWIQNTHCSSCLVGDLEVPEDVNVILSKYQSQESMLNTNNIPAVKPEVIEKLQAAGIKVNPVAIGNPLLEVDLSNNDSITQKQIRLLRKIRKNVVTLDLSNSNFSDGMSGILQKLEKLESLRLQKTEITDQALQNLSTLKYLKSLNLYGTSVGDASIEKLLQMSSLKSLYAWSSQISPEGVAHLESERPLLEVHYALDDDIFGEAKLYPPEIVFEKSIFLDSLQVELKSNFRNTRIYYTLDNSDPDTNSTQYQRPFFLTETSTIKVISHKEGWHTSEVGEARVFRAGQKVEKIALSSAPNKKYSGNGAQTLVDFERGPTQFQAQEWLGFEGEHVTATLQLEESASLSNVVISTLSGQGSWIFYPTGVNVWLSRDNRNYQLVNSIKIPVEQVPGAEISLFDISFEPKEAQYVKVELKSILKNPSWHPNPGGKAWVFVDEIVVF